jgi:GWxTD domain-containing protein
MLRTVSRHLTVVFAMALIPAATPSLSSALDFPQLRADRAPFFTADIAVSVDSAGRPAMQVSVTVPYQDVQWIRLDRGYGMGVELAVVFQPKGRGRSYGDVWERRIAVPSFEATRSPNAALIEKRDFALPPGRYDMRVSVADLSADEGSSASQRIEVPDYSKVPVGFADLDLGVSDSSGAFVAMPTRRLGMNASRLAARAAVFDRRPGSWPRRYSFRYRIIDERGDELSNGSQEASVDRSAQPVIIRPPASELFVGSYVFQLDLVEGHSRWRVERSFEVEESGPPRGREFERMLEPLGYIADAGEIEALRALPPEQQPAGWDAFWRRRDPTPETARNEAMLEFFRRVHYAEQHFQGFGPGWRSDMGRIYIKLGPPDQVETRPASSQTVQQEIWYYNRPYRRLVFEDREGFGRYLLITPIPE